MPPAVIGGVIAGVGAIGGAVLGSSAQKKAASQAADASAGATAAQLALGRESLNLNKDIYNSNYNTLSPFVSRGNVAGDHINALLGLPQAPTMASPLAAPPGGGSFSSQPPFSQAEIAAMWNDGIPGNARAAQSALSAWQASNPQSGPVQHNPTGSAPAPVPVGGTPTSAPAPPAASPVTARSALDAFANSAGMDFQLQQGAKAINHGAGANGWLQSGAALKALQDHGQKTALNNYFMPYMGLLGGQQAVGAQSGAAIAGVGSSFGNTAAAINAGMGANIQNGANNAANAALARGNANAQMWSGVGSGLGSIASSFFPSGGF